MISKRDFVDWVNNIGNLHDINNFSKINHGASTTIVYNEDLNRNFSSNEIIARSVDELYKHINNLIAEGIHPDINFQTPVKAPHIIDFRRISSDNYINSIYFHGAEAGLMRFVGGFCKIVRIHTNPDAGTFDFDSCTIGSLDYSQLSDLNLSYCSVGVLTNLNPATKNVAISNCNIYGLRLNNKTLCYSDLKIDTFSNFPVKTSMYSKYSFLDNTQVYSDLRKTEQERGNVLVSNLFHTLEFRAARTYENWQTRIFNYLYQGMSDYGSSIARPLFIFSLLFTFTSMQSYKEDAVTLQQDKTYYMGWQKVLTDEGRSMAKSMVLSAQSIINIGGIIGTKNLVVAKRNTWTSYWLFFHSFLSLSSLTMFVFALRRRFKIQL